MAPHSPATPVSLCKHREGSEAFGQWLILCQTPQAPCPPPPPPPHPPGATEDRGQGSLPPFLGRSFGDLCTEMSDNLEQTLRNTEPASPSRRAAPGPAPSAMELSLQRHGHVKLDRGFGGSTGRPAWAARASGIAWPGHPGRGGGVGTGGPQLQISVWAGLQRRLGPVGESRSGCQSNQYR